jgi:hypothetical protein
MKAQKDKEVLNLFYLFNEGDLYKVAGELQPVVQPLSLVAPQRTEELATAPVPPSVPVEVQPETIVYSPIPKAPVKVMAEQPTSVVSAIYEAPAQQLALKEDSAAISEPRPVLEAQDEAFLEKVLQAVGSSLAQVDVVNVHQVAEPDYHYLFKEKRVRQFISFGVPMEELNLYLELSPYEVKLTHGIQFLSVDSLEGIRSDVERKRGLWAALKHMFNA